MKKLNLIRTKLLLFFLSTSLTLPALAVCGNFAHNGVVSYRACYDNEADYDYATFINVSINQSVHVEYVVTFAKGKPLTQSVELDPKEKSEPSFGNYRGRIINIQVTKVTRS